VAFANASGNVHVMGSLRNIVMILWPAASSDFEGGITNANCDGSCNDFCNGSSNRLSVGIGHGSFKGSWENWYNQSNSYKSSNQLVVMATAASCWYQYSNAASSWHTIIISR